MKLVYNSSVRIKKMQFGDWLERSVNSIVDYKEAGR